ncbi:hypothetical protein ACFYVL_42240 [Streptomyces sp. NPDC004111]|uniref:hypothetical protein n=1 Tax=Streptomyces sp. NPDC004111 TaxID=3364690 RepID=UPI0036887264
METGETRGDIAGGGFPRVPGPAQEAELPGAPGAREDPPAPHGTTPRTALPVRPTDRVVRAGCQLLAGLWRLTGLRRASAALRHYLAGTGAPFPLDAATLAALPPVRAAVNARLMEAEAGRWTGTDDWRGVRITPSTSVDWWLAVRGVQYRVVRPNPRYYRVEFRKSWNFDPAGSGCGIPFTPFARLHATGLAHAYVAAGRTGYLPR